MPSKMLWSQHFQLVSPLEAEFLPHSDAAFINIDTAFSSGTHMKVANPDPRTCAFLTLDPGHEIGFFRIPDPGNQTHILDSLMTNF
jgi:hypothetical protein